MFTHRQLWNAIDRIAENHGYSPSGLAKKAGLDPTSFNPSKRQGPDGRPRWPTTESIALLLDAAGATMDEFTSFLSGTKAAPERRRTIGLLGLAKAGTGGFFDDSGFPAGAAWDEIEVPGVTDPNAFALEITGNSMEPVYREGDIIIVSPAGAPRRGDRVVVKTRSGEVMAKSLLRQATKNLELQSFNAEHALISLPLTEVEWMSRIIWASQ